MFIKRSACDASKLAITSRPLAVMNSGSASPRRPAHPTTSLSASMPPPIRCLRARPSRRKLPISNLRSQAVRPRRRPPWPVRKRSTGARRSRRLASSRSETIAGEGRAVNSGGGRTFTVRRACRRGIGLPSRPLPTAERLHGLSTCTGQRGFCLFA